MNERLTDVAERFLRKGRKVYVEGSLQTRKFTDKAGQEKHTTEIVIDRFRGELTLLDSGRADDGDTLETVSRRAPAASRAAAPVERARATAAPAFAGRDDLDDEIPF